MNPYITNPFEDFRRFIRKGSYLSYILLINFSVYLLVKISYVLFFLWDKPGTAIADAWFLNTFAVPSYLPSLISKPWSIITYMFLHLDFWHILFNMLWLYWFGKIFVEFLGNKKLLITYFAGGVTGAIFYIASFNFFPVFSKSVLISYALGASASVMAIVIAISFYVPNYSIQLLFIGRVKIIYLATVLFIFDFFAIPSGNAGGHIAHIGGAVWGFCYILYLRNQNQTILANSGPEWFRKLMRIFPVSWKKVKNPGNTSRPLSDEEYNFMKNEQQKRIDEILDKISKGGYESLTKAEKEFLFKSSGKNK